LVLLVDEQAECLNVLSHFVIDGSQVIELERRGFPERDPTTGGYCIEAVDRSCFRRFPRLFRELTAVLQR